jgi:hypothetical protein
MSIYLKKLLVYIDIIADELFSNCGLPEIKTTERNLLLSSMLICMIGKPYSAIESLQPASVCPYFFVGYELAKAEGAAAIDPPGNIYSLTNYMAQNNELGAHIFSVIAFIIGVGTSFAVAKKVSKHGLMHCSSLNQIAVTLVILQSVDVARLVINFSYYMEGKFFGFKDGLYGTSVVEKHFCHDYKPKENYLPYSLGFSIFTLLLLSRLVYLASQSFNQNQVFAQFFNEAPITEIKTDAGSLYHQFSSELEANPDFVCPISTVPFIDPIKVELNYKGETYSHNYERKMLLSYWQKEFAKAQRRMADPCTNMLLKTGPFSIKTNDDLRKMIIARLDQLAKENETRQAEKATAGAGASSEPVTSITGVTPMADFAKKQKEAFMKYAMSIRQRKTAAVSPS